MGGTAPQPPSGQASLDEARLLLALAREVTSKLELQDVLDASFTALRSLVDFGGGAIQLVDRGDLVAAATHPPATPDARALRIPVGEGVSGRIAATGEPCYIPDITVDPRVYPEGRAKGVSNGVRSYFGFPLILYGAPIGVIQLDSPVPDAFPPKARMLMLAFAPTIASAVQNAQLFDGHLQTLRELREAERLKDDFIAVVSHELRTPLTSILGFSETLADRAGRLEPEVVADLAARIQSASRRLQRMVEDLLNVSEIEHSGLRVEISSFTLEPILRRTALEVTDGKHPIAMRVEPNLPRVVADPDRLSQIVGNLLSNAQKFSRPGDPIELRALALGDRVAIRVTDHGAGIPPEMLDRVFERFFRLEPAATRTTGGLGIGLYLVKLLCDRVGAGIRVESVVGMGSRFTVSLATEPAEAPPAGGATPARNDRTTARIEVSR